MWRFVGAVSIILLFLVVTRSTSQAPEASEVRPLVSVRMLIITPPPAQFGPKRTLDDILNDVIEGR